MPYPNEHSARIKDPGEFDPKSFKSKDIAPGVRIIIGKLRSGGDSMVTQTYRFNISHFTAQEAKDWCKKNNVHYISFTPATNSKDMEDSTTTGMEEKRKELGMTVAEFYAIPRDPPSESKLPIFDEAHVRNAMARLNQVQGVSASEKATAKRKIIAAAKKFGIDTTNFEKVAMGNHSNSAILKIYGDIGESTADLMGESDSNISASMVSRFLEEHKDANDIIVKINSRGGDVQEGWTIHDLLVNSGKKIKTIGEGKIYSIATIVFLAGSEREIMANADGLIHNPFIPDHTLADEYRSDDLLKIAEALKQEESKILDFYVEKTGTSAEKLAEYMKEDTKLSAEDMLNLGFATKIIEPVKAYAYFKLKNNFIMNENDVKTFGQKIDAILEKIKGLSRIEPTDQIITDKDGKKLTLTKPTGEPIVGDVASPDGTYILVDGKTIVVLSGKVTEVKPAVTAKSELELAKEMIVEIQKQLDAEKAKSKPDLVAAEAAFKAKETEARGLVTELSALKNSWKPEARGKFSSAEKVGDVNLNEVRELMGKLKNVKKE
jgi:ATP-dependent protease ClpP protease subunit